MKSLYYLKRTQVFIIFRMYKSKNMLTRYLKNESKWHESQSNLQSVLLVKMPLHTPLFLYHMNVPDNGGISNITTYFQAVNTAPRLVVINNCLILMRPSWFLHLLQLWPEVWDTLHSNDHIPCWVILLGFSGRFYPSFRTLKPLLL